MSSPNEGSSQEEGAVGKAIHDCLLVLGLNVQLSQCVRLCECIRVHVCLHLLFFIMFPCDLL